MAFSFYRRPRKEGSIMGRLVLRGAALSMAASLILAAGDTRPAQASPETTPSVTGTWRGFFRGDEGPSVTPSVLEITSQDRRRFSGELNVGGSAFEIAGTVA